MTNESTGSAEPPQYMEGRPMVDNARWLAKTGHEGQIRKFGPDKGKSYFDTHLTRVADSVKRDYPQCYEAQAVAWLHDGFEDQPGTINRDKLVTMGFPPAVIEAVEAMTHNDEEETYPEYLKRAFRNPIARIVKRKDMCDNGYTLEPGKNTGMAAKYLLGIELFDLWADMLIMMKGIVELPRRR